MKILVFSDEFPPEIGGAGAVAQEYVRCLSGASHDVTVLTRRLKHKCRTSCCKMVEVKVIWKLWFLAYKKAVNFELYDLIILNDVRAIYTAGLMLSQRALSKAIVIIHGGEPKKIFFKPSFLRRVTLFGLIYKRALKDCVLIIAVSNFMKEKFLRSANTPELESKTVVVANFVDAGVFFRREDSDFRKALGVNSEAILLSTVGRVVMDKGYLEMIEIFKRLILETRTEVYWLIVGDGPDLDTIKNLINSMKLTNNVFFLGRLRREEIPNVYSNSDLFWMLSNFEESFGLVYLEAQACGCPVLARDSGGTRESIKDGETGYLLNDDEEVFELLKSERFLKLQKTKIVNFSKKFDSHVFKRFLEIDVPRIQREKEKLFP
jgi:glycosyltransferase involved in cell wall biosynthesis